MDEYLITETITLKSPLSLDSRPVLHRDLLGLTGVEYVSFSDTGYELMIGYCPQVISADVIKSAVRKAGCEPVVPVKEKNPFKRLLQSLIKSNQKEFGDNPQLSCCELNRK